MMAHNNDDHVLQAIAVEDKTKIFDVLYRCSAEGSRAEFLAPVIRHAVSFDKVDLLTQALVLGASANTVNSNGNRFMLHLVAARGNEKAVEALLKHGAVVDALDGDGRTALQRLAFDPEDNVGAATALLAAGADASYRGNPGDCTALELALGNRNIGVIMALQKFGANINDTAVDGYTALHAAALCDQVAAISALVDAGADINALDRDQNTPLHVASVENNPGSVKALCERGADKNRRNGTGRTPLHCALTEPWSLRAAAALLDAGTDVRLRQSNADNFSALDLAAINGRADLVRRVIQRGANVDAVDARGNTPLHHAAYWSQISAIDELVRSGANVDAPDELGRRPLHRACRRQAFTAALALLRYRASVNAPDNRGQLPLHLATRVSRDNGSWVIVELLLSADADERVVDSDGHTAADVIGLDAPHGLPGGDPASNQAVLDLLAHAPVERANWAWRRRSFLVMCHALPLRAPPKPPERAGGAPRRAHGATTRKRARLAQGEGGGGGDEAGNNGGPGIARGGAAEGASVADGVEGVVAKVVGMEEGLFRNVMLFL